MPLFRRCDGELVPNLDPIRRMMPLVMCRRNESIVYHTIRWDISRARVWLRNYNRSRRERPHATLSIWFFTPVLECFMRARV